MKTSTRRNRNRRRRPHEQTELGDGGNAWRLAAHRTAPAEDDLLRRRIVTITHSRGK